MELVTLNGGQCLPADAIALAVNLEFSGWLLQRQGDSLRVVRHQDAGDDPLDEDTRQAIRLHKADLLRIVDTCEELAGQAVRTRRTRKIETQK